MTDMFAFNKTALAKKLLGNRSEALLDWSNVIR